MKVLHLTTSKVASPWLSEEVESTLSLLMERHLTLFQASHAWKDGAHRFQPMIEASAGTKRPWELKLLEAEKLQWQQVVAIINPLRPAVRTRLKKEKGKRCSSLKSSDKLHVMPAKPTSIILPQTGFERRRGWFIYQWRPRNGWKRQVYQLIHTSVQPQRRSRLLLRSFPQFLITKPPPAKPERGS